MKYILSAIAVLLVTIVAAQTPGTIVVRDGNGNPQTYNVNVDASGHFDGMYASTALNAQTTGRSVTITTGLTYQQVLATISAPSLRQSLTIQNNQISGTDVCYLLFGDANIKSQVTPGTTTTSTNLTINAATVAAGGASLILNPGQTYTRFYPLVPNDAFYVTCSTTGDSVYVDTQ